MGRKSQGILLLLIFIQGACVSGSVRVVPSINPAVVGDTVVLSLSPPATLNTGRWSVGEAPIVTWLGEQPAVFPSHTGRATVNVTTGALTLTSVTTSDTGVYTVQSDETDFSANTLLSVLEPVSNVTLQVNHTSLMELRASAVARCSVSSGSSLSFIWMNGSTEVTAGERVQLSDQNSTLTVVNVTRYDQGPFVCFVSNLVSNSSSDALNFTVVYGPDNMALTVDGQNSTSVSTGSNASLLCTAQSNPPAQLQWAFKGELINITGAHLRLHNINEGHVGPYTCLAYNNETKLSSNVTADIRISNAAPGPRSLNPGLLFVLVLFGLTMMDADSSIIHKSAAKNIPS